MTTEEALEILKPFCKCMFDQHGCPISDAAIALDVAIKALEAQTDEAIQKSQELEQAEIEKAYELGKKEALEDQQDELDGKTNDLAILNAIQTLRKTSFYGGDDPNVYKAIDTAIKALDNKFDVYENGFEDGFMEGKRAAQQWIPYEDHQPDAEGSYLVEFSGSNGASIYNHAQAVAYFWVDDMWDIAEMYNEILRMYKPFVIHAWQPLPAPYREEE